MQGGRPPPGTVSGEAEPRAGAVLFVMLVCFILGGISMVAVALIATGAKSFAMALAAGLASSFLFGLLPLSSLVTAAGYLKLRAAHPELPWTERAGFGSVCAILGLVFWGLAIIGIAVAFSQEPLAAPFAIAIPLALNAAFYGALIQPSIVVPAPEAKFAERLLRTRQKRADALAQVQALLSQDP